MATPEELQRKEEERQAKAQRARVRKLLKTPKGKCFSAPERSCKFLNRNRETRKSITLFLQGNRKSFEPCSGSCFQRTKISPASDRGTVGATVIRLEQVNRNLGRGHFGR